MHFHPHPSVLRGVTVGRDFTAWGALAHMRALWRFTRPYDERDAIATDVSTEAKHALTLDAQNQRAISAQFLLVPPFGRFADTEILTDRMKKTTRSNGDALLYRGYHLESVGHIREAIEFAQRAYDLDPLNPNAANSRGRTLLNGGRYTEARSSLETTLARWPELHYTAINLIELYLHLQDWASVDVLLAPTRLAQFPLRENQRGVVGFAAVMRDPSTQSRRRPIEAARRRFQSSGYAELLQLRLAAKFGDLDEIFALAAKAKFGPSGDNQDQMGFDAYRTNFLFHSLYPELRRDPRFVKLCARLGLVDYWLKTQLWPDCVDEVAPHYDFKAECEKVAAGPPPPPANDKWCSTAS